MARIRADYVFGTVTNDPALLVGGTTLTSAELVRLPAVTSPDVAAITLHDAEAGTYEIVHVTAHTAAANSATILRAQEGTTAQEWPAGTTWLHGLTVDDVEELATGGGGTTGLLAVAQYNPGGATTLSTTSTTPVDAEATNLAVTFTTPASGKVVVRFGAAMDQTTASKAAYWHVREGTTTVITRWMFYYANAAARADLSASAAFLITGLTPGSVHTYKWAHSTDSGGTSKIYAGGSIGPAIIEVVAA